MDLLPQELRRTLPSLYSQESSSAPIVHAKLFTPDAGWTWFITEGSEEDGDWLLFGYVIGLEGGGIFCCPKLRALKARSGFRWNATFGFSRVPLMRFFVANCLALKSYSFRE